jgi:hypothetical protein
MAFVPEPIAAVPVISGVVTVVVPSLTLVQVGVVAESTPKATSSFEPSTGVHPSVKVKVLAGVA